MLEADIREIVFLVKHFAGQHDQSTHGNRFRMIAGKPKKVHIGGTTGTLEYDHEGNPLNYGPEVPPLKKEPNTDTSEMDAKSRYERDTILTRQANDWLAKIEEDESDAIHLYTGGSYEEMNDALRENRVEDSDLSSEIKSAQTGLLKGSLDTPMTVYRGIDGNKYSIKKVLNMMSAGVGQIFTDKAFVSTSMDETKAFNGRVKLKIILPEGTKGAYVKSISKHSNEYEYLLPHSTKFKILSHDVEKNYYNYDNHTFTLQAMPTEYD
jgi:hypothetical protein